jgi:hypothetical protein
VNTSEAIVALERIRAEHGELPITVFDPDIIEYVHVNSISVQTTRVARPMLTTENMIVIESLNLCG